MGNKVKKTVLILIVFIMILLLGNLYIPRIATFLYEKAFVSAKTSNSEAFQRLLRDAAYNTISDETWNSTLGSSESLYSYLTENVSVFEYGEFGLLCHYAYLYAQKNGDNELKRLVQEKFDKNVIGNSLRRCDQVTYGNVAIDLYLATKDNRYKDYADLTYAYLDSLDRANGIIKYNPKLAEQRVDGIGLICPFLFYYSSVFCCEHSREIGNRMAEQFVRWGSDEVTGVPVKAYGLKSHVKHTSPNWGRGISWYLLGTYNMDKSDSLISKRLELLDSILLLDTDKLYPQFLDEKGAPDMSATIPVVWYLNKKGKLSLSKDELTTLFSPYCDKYGIVRFCTAVLSQHKGVDNQTSSLFCQGLLLYLFSELE